MGAVKIVKISTTVFTGEDGKDVEGRHIYVVPVDGTPGLPERIFLSDDRAAKIEYQPKVGDKVYVFRTPRGSLQDMIEA